MKDSEVIHAVILSLGRSSYSAKELTGLCRPFGVSESSVRTWLSRQLAAGYLERTGEGATAGYGLSGKGRRVSRNVSVSFTALLLKKTPLFR